MTIFDGNPPEGRSRSKFVRVDERISISSPNDTDILHGELLIQDDLLLDFAETVDERPEEVDGGFITFDTEKQRVTLNGHSTGLEIPKNLDGRIRTEDVLKEFLPDFELRSLYPSELRRKEF